VLSKDNKHVYIVDFGLAKRHLMDDLKNPVPARKKADFRGTVSFASLNAHNNVVSEDQDSITLFSSRISQEGMISGACTL